MTLPIQRPVNTRHVSVAMADASTAGSVFTGSPFKGYVRKIFVTTQATPVTVANNTFTGFIGSTAITHDALVQTFSTDAAGSVYSANVSSANFVNEGDSLKITSDGAGSSVVPVVVTFVIEAH